MSNDIDDELWSAIADPSRRQILETLLLKNDVSQTELSAGLPLTRQAVAKHLVVLERVGLIDTRKLGREVRYSLNRTTMDIAAREMNRVATRWDSRLNAIKRAAERIHRENNQND